MKGVAKRIQVFNKGRSPELLQRKYTLMRADIFAFYRGTCHLFYQDWPSKTALNNAPLVWISGDLHLENFGTYRGENRLIYFDINDFDEAALAPCTWDLARLLTSILVGNVALNVDETQAMQLCHFLVEVYGRALVKGQAHSVERATSTGMVRDLMQTLKGRSQKTFLDEHTEKHGHQRRLRIDHVHALPIPEDEYKAVQRVIESWRETQPNPDFLRVLDAVRHVAGTGSLGLENYLVLVEGNGSPSRNFLLTLKEQPPSSLQPYLTAKQPGWANEAARVVACQERIQRTTPALLGALMDSQSAYVLREYQPVADRVVLNQRNGKFGRLEKLIGTFGDIVAWDQLRCTGRQSSAIADDLIAFGHRTDWQAPLLDYVQSYLAQVKADYAAFCAAYDSGQFAPPSNTASDRAA